MKKTIILTDNRYALDLALELRRTFGEVEIYQSPNGTLSDVGRLNVKDSVSRLISDYGLVLSIHCKQFFPAELVNSMRCVNVHPGLNPHNRGWFPQVFSIINGLPSGVTIHEMDELLDHGPIIVQRKYQISSWDTSGSAYEKIMMLEREMVLEWYEAIRDQEYTAAPVVAEGNINYFRDFDEVRKLDLDEKASFGDFINRLRALTHDNYKNAHFIDENGTKIYVEISLYPESTD